jgi:hypothetical protein
VLTPLIHHKETDVLAGDATITSDGSNWIPNVEMGVTLDTATSR